MKLNKLKDKEKMIHIITYVFFGILTVAVNFISFYVLGKIFASMDENIINIISIIIAVVFAYFTNRKYVFKSKETGIFSEFCKFAGSRTFSAIFEIISFFILNTLIKLNAMIAKVLISVFVVILNYITSKLFVFCGRNKENIINEKD